jgi:ribosomal protein L10
VAGIREAAEKYASVYVFSFQNMRNLKFKEFREKLKSSSRYTFWFLVDLLKLFSELFGCWD